MMLLFNMLNHLIWSLYVDAYINSIIGAVVHVFNWRWNLFWWYLKAFSELG